MTSGYWDQQGINRARLLWAGATRQQLERWEPLVVRYWRGQFTGDDAEGATIWAAQYEHHFALVAANHLLQALDLDPKTRVPVDSTLRAELKEGRDLHEHWKENLPVFNVTPRVDVPKFSSGKSFAARNPQAGNWPYWWLGWNQGKGALLLPNVSAPDVHELVDAVEADVLAKDATFSGYIPPRAPSPWIQQDGEWWPKPEDGAGATDHIADHTPSDDEADGPQSA